MNIPEHFPDSFTVSLIRYGDKVAEQFLRTIRVVYVAGPYRAKTERGVTMNIRAAEAVAAKVWERGYCALCPHMNSSMFGGLVPDRAFLAGGLELVERSDALVLTEAWRESSGTIAEISRAIRSGKPVFETIDALPPAPVPTSGWVWPELPLMISTKVQP